MIDLSRHTALITGGNQGIGWAIAEAFASCGARVIINYPDESRRPEQVDILGAGAFAIQADVGHVANIIAMFTALDDREIDVDILVNNAGIFPRADVLELSEEEWDVVHAVNLKGAFFCAQHAARRMVKRGSGRIINIASDSSLIPSARGAHYCASKAGIVSITKSLAMALAPYGVTVNAIAPGLTDTAQPRFGMTEAEMLDYARERIPLGRLAQPQDIAQGAVFLASDLASFVTGQTIFVNGGSLMVP